MSIASSSRIGKSKAKRVLRAYISHTADQDVATLIDVLHELHVDVSGTLDLNIDFSVDALSRLKDCDFVVAVLDARSQEVMYEVGVADGLGKPVMLLITSDALLPDAFANRLYLSADLRSANTLKLSIAKFIDDLLTRKTHRAHSRNRRDLPNRDPESVKRILEVIRRSRTNPEPRNIEKIVGDLLKVVTTVVEEGYQGDRGVDFAIWDDFLTTTIGNPILVEVKTGTFGHSLFRQTQMRLLEHVAKTNSRLGLLIYFDREGRRFDVAESIWPVLAIDLEDFASQLVNDSLPRLLLDWRNRVAHAARR
jgi:nucleoside 2-deoxyribosyltransferase